MRDELEPACHCELGCVSVCVHSLAAQARVRVPPSSDHQTSQRGSSVEFKRLVTVIKAHPPLVIQSVCVKDLEAVGSLNIPALHTLVHSQTAGRARSGWHPGKCHFPAPMHTPPHFNIKHRRKQRLLARIAEA